jgi:hypothetical protein
MEYRPVRRSISLRLDVGRSDHLRPLFGVVCDELPEGGRRQRQRDAAEIEEPLLHLGIGEAGIDLLVELIDDLSRRALGRRPASRP